MLHVDSLLEIALSEWQAAATVRKVPYYMIVLSHTTPHTNLHINKSTEA
jgi:hypothetical protein